MAQKFLSQLLQIENTVKVDELEAPICMVCLESYGTLNSVTGAVELQVRLPCNHLVGTVCIATWLRDNNSCPACRTTFFPAQPRPYLEHGIMNDPPSQSTRRMGHRDETDPVEICEYLCEQLVLDDEVREVAQSISGYLSRRFQIHSPECNAAICVYIAWYLLGPNDAAANFLADLSHTARIDQDFIRSTYRFLYPSRMQLVVPEILPWLARPHMESILALLPTPNLDNGVTNGDQEDEREGRTSGETNFGTIISVEVRERSLGDFAEIRLQFSEAVGSMGLSEAVEDLAESILDIMNAQSELVDRSEQFRGAVCVFMACHLLGMEISYSELASIHGVSERPLREAYADVFTRRNELINHHLAYIMGTGNLERVLGALPALNFPPR